MLRKDEDGLIRYNYLKPAAIIEGLEQVYKTLKSKWLRRIKEV